MKTWFPPVPRWVTRATSSAWPDAAGHWPEALRPIDRVDHDAVGAAAVIHHGVLIAIVGAAAGLTGLWSSCIRTWLMLVALRLATLGQLSLDVPVGAPFPAWVTWRHVLARVSTPPSRPGALHWRYSGGDDWIWFHRALEQAGGAPCDELLQTLLLDPLGATLRPNWERDGDPSDPNKPDRGEAYRTLRLDGEPYEMAKLGYLMLRQGRWRNEQLIDPALIRMAVAGGLFGDGQPDPMQGYMTHLVRGGRYDEIGDRSSMAGVTAGYFAAGGTSRAYVVVIPSLDLVVARVRRAGVYIDQFLPELIDALEIR